MDGGERRFFQNASTKKEVSKASELNNLDGGVIIHWRWMVGKSKVNNEKLMDKTQKALLRCILCS